MEIYAMVFFRKLPLYFIILILISNPEILHAADNGESFWNDPEEKITAAELRSAIQADCPVVADNMESALPGENWNPKFIKPAERFAIQTENATEGNSALSVELQKQDEPNSSGKYKHELRIANSKRCLFGQEVWYSFSFFVDGEFPEIGSTRWVIGQWKEESGASPFLAQRFDNGVFH
ncbi:MAG: heparin lyase I family protein [Rhizobiaceae bacterium]